MCTGTYQKTHRTHCRGTLKQISRMQRLWGSGWLELGSWRMLRPHRKTSHRRINVGAFENSMPAWSKITTHTAVAADAKPARIAILMYFFSNCELLLSPQLRCKISRKRSCSVINNKVLNPRKIRVQSFNRLFLEYR